MFSSLTVMCMTSTQPKILLSTPLDVAPCKAILVEYFPKGYRLESALDMKRMRRYYEELTGKALDLNQAILETAIRNCGIVYDGRLYMPQNMLSDEMRDQILFFIERCFDEGRSAVYYEAVFREFSEKLLDHNIFNADMLKAYLTYYVSDQYYMGRSYLAKEYRDDVDPIDEVRQCLKQYDFPVQVDELCDSLSHITEERIRFILGSNGEFVRNSKGEYFHADSLELTKEELENIAAIIDSTIEEHEFISGNELYDAIQTKYPYTFEKNAVFSVIGWRDALKYKFGDRFSFVGNIVSRAGTSLSMSDVFAEYGKGRQRFSIDELEQFAESIGTTIYFDSLYTNAIRISHEWFTSKGGAKFSVKETDAVLDRFCDGDYIPLQDVKEFALFPESSFPWTEYLLEQYVAFFSEKFYLMHGNYNKYLSKNEGLPIVVDVQNEADQIELVQHYHVGKNELITASKYCAPDEMPRYEELLNDLATLDGVLIVTGTTSYLKLDGEQELQRFMRKVLSMSIKGHVIFITYQCKRYLPLYDQRIARRIVVMENSEKKAPDIVFTDPSIPLPTKYEAIKGMENFAAMVEARSVDTMYVVTRKSKDVFPHSLYNITSLQNAYDALLLKDDSTRVLPEKIGTSAQWSYAMKLFEHKSKWADVIDDEFGGHTMLEHIFANYANFSTDRKWLYFIALKLFGAKNNWCLTTAARKRLNFSIAIQFGYN